MSKLNKSKTKRDPRGGKAMGELWDTLTQHERAMCLMVLRTFGELGYDIHMGHLPLMGVATVNRALQTARQMDDGNKATYLRLLRKLNGTTADTSKMLTMTMVLRHKKVVKRFGGTAERGARIPFTQRFQTTAGLRWSLPAQSYVDDTEAKVWPIFKMTFTRRIDKDWSEYMVVCPKLHSNVMKNWLNTYCR